MPDRSIRTYRAKRDFAATPEPAGSTESGGRVGAAGGLFVVQKHTAKVAGLHWDFRLEHGGVLWSWAVPKGPSLDPADKRLAIHVEDHPIDYADFQGVIPKGEYGGGNVETWDRGRWQPIGDPDEGMREGKLAFTLNGQRLNGRYTLVRLAHSDKRKAEAWFLIKGHDDAERAGGTAPALEKAGALGQADVPEQTGAPEQAGAEQAAAPEPTGAPQHALAPERAAAPEHALAPERAAAPEQAGAQENGKPAEGAVPGAIPADQRPQLCDTAETPPDGEEWVNEIKFDGYRLLAWIDNGTIRLVTRNGHDWTERLPALAKALAGLNVTSAVLDGELVAPRDDGSTSFPDLQAALSEGREAQLCFYLFDLLALNGWDMRPCRLADRKRVLEGLDAWRGRLRYSAHIAGRAAAMRRRACEMKLEGIVCKRADAPYRSGRGHGWVKVKCLGREEFVVVGWTPPAGHRTGLGALHLGYFDPGGVLHYAGGVGSGFSEQELAALRKRLDGLEAPRPRDMRIAGDPLDAAIRWVRPELVAEVRFTAWSGSGRLRHAVFLGLREDKAARDVVREAPDRDMTAHANTLGANALGAAPPAAARDIPPAAASRIVVARAPRRPATRVGGVELTHPDRELWPGISKRDLADYWLRVADAALPNLAHRPLSIVRCPEGIGGEKFFQKNGHGHLPAQIRENSASGSPYLAIDDSAGLVALAQMSAIDLHPWGATEADPLHPDWLVFDLDPGEGLAFGAVVAAALEVRDRLERLGLRSFCRTTGGKGLHVVVPLVPRADWKLARTFCHAFAETMAREAPDKYVAHVKIADRRGRVLVDWLRNGLGATAVASFSPRSRPGAGVATPLAWREVTDKLEPAGFTLLTVPARLAKLKKDPWDGFHGTPQSLPQLTPPDLGPPELGPPGPAPSDLAPPNLGTAHLDEPSASIAPRPGGKPVTPGGSGTIVVARKPKRRSS